VDQSLIKVRHNNSDLTSPGSWIWPVNSLAAKNNFTTTNKAKGIDISGPRGRPIYAALSGTVVYTGDALQGYGNLIIIKHKGNYLSAYAHNDEIMVHEKQKIRTGQVISKMGSTGTDSVKLHFEIRYRGQAEDPLNYLPK
jgi:lipoprotein NlpD